MIELAVSSRNELTARKNTHSSYWAFADRAPEGSYFEIQDGITIASPELCFVQLMPRLSFYGRLAIGYELCGRYSVVGDYMTKAQDFRFARPSDSDYGEQLGEFRTAEPIDVAAHTRMTSRKTSLTNVEKLVAYVEGLPAMKGKLAAQKCLHWVIDNAYSPREADLAINMCLPPRYGGFGLPKPKLNHAFAMSREGERLTGRRQLVCDCFWPQHGIALEYDSNLYHTGNAQYVQDLNKVAALENMGIRVITFSTDLFNEFFTFENYMNSIRANMGFEPIKLTAEKSRKRSELFTVIRSAKNRSLFHTS